MIIGVLTVDLRIGYSRSLKEKRSVIKKLTERTRQKFNVSVAEVGHQDDWKLSTLGVVCVSNETLHVHRILEAVSSFIEENLEGEVINIVKEVL